VGKGLDASVDLLVSDAALTQLLTRYTTALPELFNVSQVTLKEATASGDPQRIPVVAITVPASGTKCERCWRYTNDVGNEAKYPTVCLRCSEALEAIGYPPYAASTNA
jgi:isoleucyl-tRNA synthetase